MPADSFTMSDKTKVRVRFENPDGTWLETVMAHPMELGLRPGPGGTFNGFEPGNIMLLEGAIASGTLGDKPVDSLSAKERVIVSLMRRGYAAKKLEEMVVLMPPDTVQAPGADRCSCPMSVRETGRHSVGCACYDGHKANDTEGRAGA